MAAQVCSNGGADALPLCFLQDLLGVAAFLASYPLHAAYALFFSRYLVSLAAFFCPLLVSTSLLLAVLVTAAPYVYPEWTGVSYSLGRTCGVAVDALCGEVRPDGAGVELAVQICSFVLGSADGAGVGEIMSDITSGSCFLWEEKSLLSGTEECCKLGVELPLLQTLIGEKILSDHGKFGEIQCGIEDKIVLVCEDVNEFKGRSASSSENSFSSERFVPGMEEEDRVRDAKRLECDPAGSVEIKKCEQVRSCSSVSGRIRQWESQVCRSFIQLPEDTPLESFSLEKRSLMEMKESAQLETKARDKTIQAQEIPIVEESVQVQQQQGQELKQSDTKTFSEKCSQVEAEELSASVARPREEWIEQERKDLQAGQEWQEQSHKDVQAEQDPQEQEHDYTEELRDQEHKVAQPDPAVELHGADQCKDADVESASPCDDARADSLNCTPAARRVVRSRTTPENLVSEGSPRKEKEWKRTLACRLYEERMKLKVCREPAAMGCNDDMDMLWEAYEAAGSGDKAKGASTQEGENEDEGSVRQLCCLQALNFSTRKMNFAGGKPSLAKISKVLRRMTALSRIRSGRG